MLQTTKILHGHQVSFFLYTYQREAVFCGFRKVDNVEVLHDLNMLKQYLMRCENKWLLLRCYEKQMYKNNSSDAKRASTKRHFWRKGWALVV